MKHQSFIIFTLCTLVLILTGCTKKEYIYVNVAPKLELVVVNTVGNVQEGAVINLYKTEADFYSKTNSTRNGSSDVNGICVFENLDESIYYFYMEKGGLNNYYEEVTFSSPLKINEIKKIQCTIR